MFFAFGKWVRIEVVRARYANALVKRARYANALVKPKLDPDPGLIDL